MFTFNTNDLNLLKILFSNDMIIMQIKYIKQVYFIGIGGIGMSALAKWFSLIGKKVAGYDKIPSDLTQNLQKNNIAIHFEDDTKLIPHSFKDFKQKNKTLIVYTPAIPNNHTEYLFFKNADFIIYKRSEILGLLSQSYFTLAIAGTHGKTSTAALLAHLLIEANLPCLAFVGGILQKYESNLLWNRPKENPILVVEADEFDRSFLNLSPNIAVITALENDHLDIYETDEGVKKGYLAFIKKIKTTGTLYIAQSVNLDNFIPDLKVLYYGLEGKDIWAKKISPFSTGFQFDYYAEKTKINNLIMPVMGFHNVENALVAISLAQELGVSVNNVRKSLKSYKGVKRRFEYILKKPNIFVDDYAHHPTEIEAFLISLKTIYPDKKITAIFQPHLFTRTRDFAKGFAKALDLADSIFLLPIYPARELPIKGVESNLIFEKLKSKEKYLTSKSEVLDILTHSKPEVLATIGAGDIDRLIPKLKKCLKI